MLLFVMDSCTRIDINYLPLDSVFTIFSKSIYISALRVYICKLYGLVFMITIKNMVTISF